MGAAGRHHGRCTVSYIIGLFYVAHRLLSGLLLLCVPPTSDVDALRAVKWHPKEPDTLAVASDNKIYVIDLANTLALHNQPLPHADLHHIGQLFTVSSVCH